MSDDGRDPFAIPKDMRTMAEASFEQARKAFDKFMESAKTTAGSMEERRESVRSGAKEIGSKAVAYAEKNVQASLDYAQSLLKAKDLPEVMKLHSEYVQSQMRSLAEQASEMGQIVSRARHQRDIDALGCEPLGGCQPDAFRSARDQRRTAGKL